MEEGRESVAASGYIGGAGASSGKDDISASGSPTPTPSPSASPPPPPPPPVAPAGATSAASAADPGMGLIMGVGMAPPHRPLGLGGMGRAVGMGMAATSMMGVGNVGFGEDLLSRKKRERPRKYGPEGSMHGGGASLTLSSPASSVVSFSSVSAGEYFSSDQSPGAKRRRGRPRGSGRRQLLAALGELSYALSKVELPTNLPTG